MYEAWIRDESELWFISKVSVSYHKSLKKLYTALCEQP